MATEAWPYVQNTQLHSQLAHTLLIRPFLLHCHFTYIQFFSNQIRFSLKPLQSEIVFLSGLISDFEI